MTTTYTIKETELGIDFLESVKRLFKNKTVAITIEETLDETEYLLSSTKNKKRLLESIQQSKNSETLKFKS